MKFSQRWWVIVALLFAFAVTVSFLAAQTGEPSAVNAPSSAEVQSSSDELEQKQPALAPNRDTVSAVNVETERRFNELRRELLDNREKTIDSWLVVIAIVITFFGIAIPIMAYNRLNKLEESEKEARRYVEEIKTIRDKTEIDWAVSGAILLQQQNRTDEAIEKWRSIANITEGTDDERAAEAWFNIGYLTSPKNVEGEDFKGAITAYNKAIELNPNLPVAYYNRGNAKTSLGQTESAIADYDEALRLNSSYVLVYINRGNAKAQLNRIDEARQDLETALNLARAVGNADLIALVARRLESFDRGDAP